MERVPSGLLAGVAAFAVAVAAFSLPAYAATFIEFDPSGSADTLPNAISGGVIAGDYCDSSGFCHGFLRAADGSITSFDCPEAYGIGVTSINDKGSIVGGCNYVSGIAHTFIHRYDGSAFVRTADGTITTFNVAGSVATSAESINSGGAIAGVYEDSNSDFHGYFRAADGTITPFDPAGSVYTIPQSINRGGVIAGYYEGSDGVYHGFARAADGSITTIDVPGATATSASAINNAGTITGDYGKDGISHGFVRTADGTITTFDPPGSTLTQSGSIAKSGTITGDYEDSSGVFHGFIRKATGKIKSFDAPGGTLTIPLAIDSTRTDKDAITGYYEDSSGIAHGFLRMP